MTVVEKAKISYQNKQNPFKTHLLPPFSRIKERMVVEQLYRAISISHRFKIPNKHQSNKTEICFQSFQTLMIIGRMTPNFNSTHIEQQYYHGNFFICLLSVKIFYRHKYIWIITIIKQHNTEFCTLKNERRKKSFTFVDMANLILKLFFLKVVTSITTINYIYI